MEKQNELLDKLYFDPSGFQSQQKIYEEAKATDKQLA